MKKEQKNVIMTGITNFEIGKTYTYILYDATFKSDTFYVGKSVNPKKRINGHKNEAINNEDNQRKSNWMKDVEKNSGKIVMHVICEVPTYMTWQEAEIATIKFLKWCGIKLANSTIGGDENGFGKLEEEQVIDILKLFCDEVDIRNIHNKYSFIALDTIRRIKYGRYWGYVIDLLDEIYKQKLLFIRNNKVGSFTGKKHTEESRKKISEHHKGKSIFNDEEKKKRSIRFSGNSNPKYNNNIDNDIIIQKCNEKKSPVEIAEEIGMSYNFVYRRIKMLIKNGTINKINTKPARHIYTKEMRKQKSIQGRGRASKFKKQDIIKIYELIACGYSTDQLLDLYPFVNRSAINRIISGKNWGYIINEVNEDIRRKIIQRRK